jgi:hypothetical protein
MEWCGFPSRLSGIHGFGVFGQNLIQHGDFAFFRRIENGIFGGLPGRAGQAEQEAG